MSASAHEMAVADGVNVNYDVYRIRTEISEQGSKVDAGHYVEKRERDTRKTRWEELDDDFEYDPNQLSRSLVEAVNPDRHIEQAKADSGMPPDADCRECDENRPYKQRLDFTSVKELAEAISQPPYLWNESQLWQAYAALEKSKVDDFSYAPFVQAGGLGKVYQLFGDDLT